MYKIDQKLIKENTIPILIIIVATLIGYHKLFLGYNLWFYVDQLVNSDWTYGTSLGNGWRPDKGFGISFFYADLATWHPWTIISFWERLVSSRVLAYNTVVVFQSIMSAIAMYCLLRRVDSRLSPVICSLIAPLIIFTVSMDSVHFNRHNVVILIAVPLLIIILYDYYKRPKYLHFFLAIILSWYVLFFCGFRPWSVIPSIGFVFTILYCIYYKDSWGKIFSKFILIFCVAAIGTFLLGFWEIYTVLIEKNLIEYVREKIYPSGALSIIPDFKALVIYFLQLFQFYTIPTDVTFPGLGWRPFYFSWNVVPFFPLLLIFFLFRRSATFWEFSLKWLLLVFYVSVAMMQIPAFETIRTSINSALKSRFGDFILPLIAFYGFSWFVFVKPFQLGLVGIFLSKIIENQCEIKNSWGKKIQILVAYVLFVSFILWTVFCFFAILLPGFLPNILSYVAERFGPERFGGFSKEYLVYGIEINTKILQSVMHWHSLVYYLLTALLMFFFMRSKKYFPLTRNRVVIISGTLLFCGILYSWSVYPLNNKPLIWEEVSSELPEFKPTDRFYFVKGKSLSQYPRDLKTLKEIKSRVKAAGGPIRFSKNRTGHNEPPGINFSAHRSFTQKEVSEFMYQIFNSGDENRINNLRELYYGVPLFSSDLIDMGAVSYYHSEREIINPPDNISLVFKSDHLWIYKNHAAWPYFYLADRLEVKEDWKHLENVKRGTAYVNEKDIFQLPVSTRESWIQMKEFKYGHMIFDYYGDKENFLVVADAWHPFWKATVGDNNLPVIKANEIFKGIKLPPGENTLTLYFDTSPYFPGVYVSIVAWIIFIMGLFSTLKYKRDKPYFR